MAGPGADTDTMITVSCRSCGSDLEDPRDAVCMHCGMPVAGRGAVPETAPERHDEDQDHAPEPPDPSTQSEPMPPAAPGPVLSNESMWKLGLWGALVVSIVAVGAITATLLSAATRSPEPDPSQSSAASTETVAGGSAAEPALLTPDFDQPLGAAVTVDHPALNELTRLHLDDGILTVRVDGNYCGRGEGTITATGQITNYSMARQRFDYTITVDLIRAWNRSVIGTLETTVEAVDPLESAEWAVEMVSSRVATIDCDVISVVATPRS